MWPHLPLHLRLLLHSLLACAALAQPEAVNGTGPGYAWFCIGQHTACSSPRASATLPGIVYMGGGTDVDAGEADEARTAPGAPQPLPLARAVSAPAAAPSHASSSSSSGGRSWADVTLAALVGVSLPVPAAAAAATAAAAADAPPSPPKEQAAVAAAEGDRAAEGEALGWLDVLGGAVTLAGLLLLFRARR